MARQSTQLFTPTISAPADREETADVRVYIIRQAVNREKINANIIAHILSFRGRTVSFVFFFLKTSHTQLHLELLFPQVTDI
jgi:hypothetical protein